jgi:hypothetical protein
MTPCPACDTPVDSLRSRFVGVRDGKVVAYCSAECAAGRPRATAEWARSPASGVPVRIPTPPAGMPPLAGLPDGLGGAVDSGPVIEILHEPASGVVTSAPDRRSEPHARHPDEIPIAAFWAADRAERERSRGPAADAPGVRGEPAGGSDRDSAEASARAGGPADAARATRGDTAERRGGDSADVDSTDAQDRGQHAPAQIVRATPRALPTSEGMQAASSDSLRRVAGSAGGSGDDAAGASGLAADAAGAPGSAAERAGDDSAEASVRPRAPELREAEEAGRAVRRDPRAGTGAARDATRSRRRGSRWPVVLLILALAGAGAGLLYHFVGGLTGRTGRAMGAVRGASPPVAAAPAARAELSRPVRPSQAAAAPAVDAAAAVELARTALRRDLGATSLRVQRLAAVALARTQDPEACALLAAQLGLGPADAPVARAGETDELAGNDIARLDLAYALARGGDRRGVDVLARALGAPRGEARDEAAGLLARLGDRRAVPHLLDLLAVEQRRLAAAEHLARLAEPRALQVLDHVRGDPRASADDKARATVALGIAGRGAVAGALRDMLGDPHFNAFAAAALAAQGDRTARPVLERQLASPPLRVQAARSLRRLDAAIDPRPLLPPLLDVVRAGRDIDRIPAAEAILLLAGPAGWSAYD